MHQQHQQNANSGFQQNNGPYGQQQQHAEHFNQNVNSAQQQQLQPIQHGPLDAAAPNSPGASSAGAGRTQISGGRFDFEDGGTYCGGWEEGKAHGNGVCTGPKHQGAYSGAWNYGFEVSGVYIWPSGSSFEGQWQNGRRHGLGVETRGRWIYRGEWTSGSKGRYGVRQSTSSTAKYEGTWAGGLQDGYGTETYADGGSYQGQWQEGKRHGYGVRTSAPFGLASHYRPKVLQTSMTSLHSNGNPDPGEKRNHRLDEVRGGFVLKAKSDEPPARRNSLVEKTKKGLLSGLKLKKQRSTSDLEKRGTIQSGSLRSTVSTASWISTGSSQSAMSNKSYHSDSNASFTVDEEHLDPSITEVYMGEWKRDKRDGYGISERSDGLRYEGEWHNNKKHGYGVTTLRDGTREEGKYKCNVLITSKKKKHLFLIRSAKFRERIDASVSSAQRASKYALQKADIAVSRAATARGKADMADNTADHAKLDSEVAVATAREFAPDFKPSVLDRFDRIRDRERFRPIQPDATTTPTASATSPPAPSKSALMQQKSPPHYPYNNIAQPAMSSSTPHKHTQFVDDQSTAAQQRRASMLMMQKQDTFDSVTQQHQQPMANMYKPAAPPVPAMMNNAMPNPNYVPPPNALLQQQQQQQQQYPGMMDAHGKLNAHQTADMNNYGWQQPQQPAAANHAAAATFSNEQFLAAQQRENNIYYSSMNSGPNNYNTGNYNNGIDPAMSPYADAQLHHQQHLQQQQQPPPEAANASIDHFDHYKRVPSRDSSMDRYARAASRMGAAGSRQPSMDRPTVGGAAPTTNTNATTTQHEPTPEKHRPRSDSATQRLSISGGLVGASGAVLGALGAGVRGGTPTAGASKRPSITSLRAGGGGIGGASPQHSAVYSSPNQPFEDVLLRQRTLGQDIIPSPREPKRTESLYLPPKPLIGNGGAKMAAGGGGGGGRPLKSVPIGMPLSRKKSLPHVQELPMATDQMSREEVSALGSARREEVRRQIENSEKLKANPLLYLVSPQVKDWFSRQQLVLVVLLVNIALGIVFFKMLT